MNKIVLGQYDGCIAWLDEEGTPWLIACIEPGVSSLDISFVAPKDVDIYDGVYQRKDSPSYKDWTYRSYIDDNQNYCSMGYHPENQDGLCYWRMSLDSPIALVEKNLTPIARALNCANIVGETIQQISDLLDFSSKSVDKP